jgi:hypothetical protein
MMRAPRERARRHMAKRPTKREKKNEGKSKRSPAKKRAELYQLLKRTVGDVPASQLRARAADINAELAAQMLSVAWLKLHYAGRDPEGNGWVKADDITFASSSRVSWSIWPEWAYGVAEGAIHFDKHLFVVYSTSGDPPDGNNITLALCSDAGD